MNARKQLIGLNLPLVLLTSLVAQSAMAGHVGIFARVDEASEYRNVAGEDGRKIFHEVRLDATGENALVCYEGLYTAIDTVYELAFAVDAEAEGVVYSVPEGTENEYFQPITVVMSGADDGKALGQFVMPPCR